MPDVVVEVDRSVPLRNALVLTAFPTLGNVAAIAARFLVQVAELECIGSVYSPDLPPLASVHDGAPDTAIEIYAGERACGVDGVCESLIVVTSQVPVPEEVAHDLAVAILDWSREVGNGEVAALEGLKHGEAQAPEILGVASLEAGRERLRSHDIALLKEGFIGGITGVMLHRGAAWGVNVYGLLARANESEPDARAAAMLVRAVDQLLVRAGFDEKALEASIVEIEGAVKERQEDARKQVSTQRDVAYL